MRKLLLIGVVGFILAGCGEDKITNEYFVGEWNCEGKSYLSKMENGKFTEYMRTGDFRVKEKYKYENNQLYFFNEYKNQWVEKNMLDEYSGEPFFKENSGFQQKFTGEIKKISSDQYSVKEEIIMESKSDNHDFDDKTKTEGICTRIK